MKHKNHPWRVVGSLAALLLFRCGPPVYEPFDGAAWTERATPLRWPTGAVGIVTNNGEDTISLIDVAGFRVTETRRVGLDPLGIDGPHHAVIANGMLFTPFAYPAPEVIPGPHGNHGNSDVPGILAALSLVDMRPMATLPTALNPGDIAATADGARVFVSHFDLRRVVTQPTGTIDQWRASVRIFRTQPFMQEADVSVCIAPHGMAVAPDGSRLYVACNGEDSIGVVDLRTPGFPVERVAVGPGAGSLPGTLRYGPYSLALSRDGNELWVGGLEGDLARGKDLRVFDTRNLRATPRVVSFGAAVFFPAFSADEATLYVPLQGPDGVAAVDRVSLQVRRRNFRAGECRLPHQVARGPEGGIYLLCEGEHATSPQTRGALLRIDPMTLETTARLELGIYPDVVFFLPSAPR